MTAMLQFEVRGSTGHHHTIKAGSTGPGNAWLSCTCPAGENGMYCKHRFALLDGDITSLVMGDTGDVERLRGIVTGSDVAFWIKRVRECERAHAAAKASLSKAKKSLAIAMRN